MARPELGTKRVCPTTGRKFYDLNRDPIVSPYTGEVIPRTALETAARAVPAALRNREEEDEEAEVLPAGAEMVSLEDVEASEEKAAGADEDVAIEDEAATDDTFLEEEEEGGDDVADLIDSDMEDDEEG